jgi:hypothetical protein
MKREEILDGWRILHSVKLHNSYSAASTYNYNDKVRTER